MCFQTIPSLCQNWCALARPGDSDPAAVLSLSRETQNHAPIPDRPGAMPLRDSLRSLSSSTSNAHTRSLSALCSRRRVCRFGCQRLFCLAACAVAILPVEEDFHGKLKRGDPNLEGGAKALLARSCLRSVEPPGTREREDAASGEPRVDDVAETGDGTARDVSGARPARRRG